MKEKHFNQRELVALPITLPVSFLHIILGLLDESSAFFPLWYLDFFNLLKVTDCPIVSRFAAVGSVLCVPACVLCTPDCGALCLPVC